MENPRYYWGVQTQTADINLSADEAEVTQVGGLVFWRWRDGERAYQIMAFAPGTWTQFFAANAMDGGPVSAIENWIIRQDPAGYDVDAFFNIIQEELLKESAPKLAARLGLAPGTVYNWRHRRSAPTAATIHSICAKLGRKPPRPS